MQLRSLFAALILAGSALAACSGNFGAGTSSPGGILPSGPLGGVNASPTPTPNAASGIVTYGESAAFQPLPSAAGYGGAIAFPVPSPRPSGFEAIPVGVTVAVVSPTDAPNLNLQSGGKKPKQRARSARSLVYVSLLATRDISLSSFPRIAVDVPRDIVTTYRENELGLALYNAGDKEKTYKLAVAERDAASPPPLPSAAPSAPPPPTSAAATAAATSAPSSLPSPVPSGFPTGLVTSAPNPNARGGPGSASGAPSASPTLPPQRIVFAGTAAPLKLTANRAAVFAVYALPIATPTPGPSSTAAAAASGRPSTGAGATASAGGTAPSAAPPSAQATGTATALPVRSPSPLPT